MITTHPVSTDPAAVPTELADAARTANWDRVIALLDDPRSRTPTNTWRPGGTSWYTPLHQAAWHGAPADVVTALLDRGAWRTLPTATGLLAHQIAIDHGHHHLTDLLTPQAPLAAEVIRTLDAALYNLIDDRVPRELHAPWRYPTTAVLPELPLLTDIDAEPLRVWFPIPGWYGGFALRLLNRITVEVTSWSRVVGGSGQRHYLTPAGTRLVEDGFV